MLISICIPAYKNVVYLERLLDSIKKQSFVDYEVIITDDSPDDEVKEFVNQYSANFPIHYFKNEKPLGTPENWNESIRKAKGEWIKLMHDDDWFTTADSLKQYFDMATQGYDCIFSGYDSVNEDNSLITARTVSSNSFKKIKDYPYYLFGNNIIGPPSVLLFKKDMKEIYDPQLKWLVDIEAYIRMIKKYKCAYIPEALISMGCHNAQVTKDCFQNPNVEIFEALIYYKKHGKIVYRRLMAYDSWWRMVRNLNIRTKSDLTYYAKGETIPEFLIKILEFQKRIPASLLNNRFISKFSMTISYVLNKISG